MEPQLRRCWTTCPCLLYPIALFPLLNVCNSVWVHKLFLIELQFHLIYIIDLASRRSSYIGCWDILAWVICLSLLYLTLLCSMINCLMLEHVLLKYETRLWPPHNNKQRASSSPQTIYSDGNIYHRHCKHFTTLTSVLKGNFFLVKPSVLQGNLWSFQFKKTCKYCKLC